MGVGRALLDPARRRRAAAALFPALGVQRRALNRAGGEPWRLLSTNFPPWPTVYQQARRWVEAGCFEELVHDLRLLLRRVLHSSPQSGGRAGYDGHKRRKDSKLHQAVDTLASLLALTVTQANVDERTQVAALATQVQAVTGDQKERVWVDHGYTGVWVKT